MYESKHHSLLPNRQFLRRILVHLLYAVAVMAITLLIGVVAHIVLEPVSWHDALLNSALIVGGIGPFIIPTTALGKLFFAVYGMFVGLVFVGTMGVILAPLVHRIIHKFHLDDED